MWNEDLFQTLLQMDEETVQKMMDRMRYIVEADVGRTPTPGFEATRMQTSISTSKRPRKNQKG